MGTALSGHLRADDWGRYGVEFGEPGGGHFHGNGMAVDMVG